MDLKQLKALVTIAETGSVTKAAEILHIVQPALSRQVKLLEDELGVQLFERERHGMVLTAHGRLFVERVRRALDELDKGKKEISPQKKQLTGFVTIGFLPSAADVLVSSVMGRVRRDYPFIHLRSTVQYVEDLAVSLEKGEVDVALMYSIGLASSDKVGYEALLDESLFLVGSADAGLDMQSPITVNELNDIPLILPAMPQSLRALVERECTLVGTNLNVVTETASGNVQKALVLQGAGLSILPGLVIADELSSGILTACPISAPHLRRRLHLARSLVKQSTEASSKVEAILRATVREHVLDGGWPGAVLT
jgi:LysR family transcriptional regulator, nitrogen assimilation regulatory protein